MPSFVLACLAYLSVAVPGSTLGLLWPSMRLGFHQPVGALGILLAFGVAASVISSVATGRLMAKIHVGTLVAIATLLVAAALGEEALAPSLWVFAVGTVLFGAGFGALDSTLNAHAASHFGARDINWMHASYGLGATIGPLATTAVLGAGLSWRWAYGTMAVGLTALACLFAAARRSWATRQHPSWRRKQARTSNCAQAQGQLGPRNRLKQPSSTPSSSVPSRPASNPVPGSGGTCSSPRDAVFPTRRREWLWRRTGQ